VEPKEQFAANLSRLRKAAGITQMELGDRCGMHLTAISRLERGLRDPHLSTLANLAHGLGVPLVELIDRVEYSES
jgi:transcriptional regulator with XRE-family HTH domain